jgi:hypothetical protein
MDATAPPGKGNAALRGAAISKLIGLAEHNSGSRFTQPCTHPVTRTESGGCRLTKSRYGSTL